MTHEKPRIVFLHDLLRYVGKGPAEELERGLKSAQAGQRR
jgi:hypothetical protein